MERLGFYMGWRASGWMDRMKRGEQMDGQDEKAPNSKQ
jgi:hypothetical protein